MLTITIYRARSMEEGQLWSLALDVVLERLQGRNSGIDLLTMTGATDRWDYNYISFVFLYYYLFFTRNCDGIISNFIDTC